MSHIILAELRRVCRSVSQIFFSAELSDSSAQICEKTVKIINYKTTNNRRRSQLNLTLPDLEQIAKTFHLKDKHELI
jgi:hypothetical protein